MHRHTTFALTITLLIASPTLANDPHLHHAPHPDLQPGPDTTVIDGPFHPDGSPNYVAALNEIAADDITPEDNAFLPIAQLLAPRPDDPDIDPDIRAQWNLTFEHLGIDPPDENTPRFIRLREFAQQQNLDLDLDQLIDLHAGPWTRDDDPLVAEWLDANAEALNVLTSALQRPRYYAPDVSTTELPVLEGILLPHLTELRDLARILLVRAQKHLGNDRLDAAWTDIQTIRKLAHQHSHEFTIISALVAMSIETMPIDDFFNALAQHDQLTADQTRTMIDDWNALPPRQPLDNAMLGERFQMLDTLISLSLWSESLSDWLKAAHGLDEFVDWYHDDYAPTYKLITSEHYDINIALRWINERFDDFAPALAGDPHHAFDLAQQAPQRIEDILDPDDDLPPAQQFEQYWANQLPDEPAVAHSRAAVDTFLEARSTLSLPQTFRSHLHAKLKSDLVPPAIALAAYHNEHGDYPDSLDALVPEYFDAVPTDPMDDQPLRYRIEDDFIKIYSIGPNLTDNGGTQRRAGNPDLSDMTLRLPR